MTGSRMHPTRGIFGSLLAIQMLCCSGGTAESAQQGQPTGSAVRPVWEPDCAVYEKDGWILLVDYLQMAPRSEGQVGWLFYQGSLLTTPESGGIVNTPLGRLRHWGTSRAHAWEVSGWNFADRAAIRSSTTLRGQASNAATASEDSVRWRYRYVHHGRLVSLDPSPSRVAIRGTEDRVTVFLKSPAAERLEPDPLGQREDIRQGGWTLLRVRPAEEQADETAPLPLVARLAKINEVEIQPVFETDGTIRFPTEEILVRCRAPMTPEDFRLGVGPQIAQQFADIRAVSGQRLLVALRQARLAATFQASRVLASFAFVDYAEPKFVVVNGP